MMFTNFNRIVLLMTIVLSLFGSLMWLISIDEACYHDEITQRDKPKRDYFRQLNIFRTICKVPLV